MSCRKQVFLFPFVNSHKFSLQRCNQKRKFAMFRSTSRIRKLTPVVHLTKRRFWIPPEDDHEQMARSMATFSVYVALAYAVGMIMFR